MTGLMEGDFAEVRIVKRMTLQFICEECGLYCGNVHCWHLQRLAGMRAAIAGVVKSPPTPRDTTGAIMGTSIITATTFTFATIIDVRPQASSTPVALAVEEVESEIPACALNSIPRCGWTARKHCGRSNVHK
ncbi:hypothetical protein [Anatilimnocola floriformis]|uniref:hypothetical protein n=1 Tax=Anatilimnocola floriformis TaxID=2948575 RepID=UPI0020C30BD3|nr:hypothetical protein [Anatilimnocola floriformis]